jgi:hypothetical protein
MKGKSSQQEEAGNVFQVVLVSTGTIATDTSVAIVCEIVDVLPLSTVSDQWRASATVNELRRQTQNRVAKRTSHYY